MAGRGGHVALVELFLRRGAAINARVARVVYGAADPKAGAARTLYRLLDDARLNHQVEVVTGVRSAECGALLSGFFQRKRS